MDVYQISTIASPLPQPLFLLQSSWRPSYLTAPCASTQPPSPPSFPSTTSTSDRPSRRWRRRRQLQRRAHQTVHVHVVRQGRDACATL